MDDAPRTPGPLDEQTILDDAALEQDGERRQDEVDDAGPTDTAATTP